MKSQWSVMLCVAYVVGCGSSQPTVTAPAIPLHHPWRLFPLMENNAWAYDVDTGDGDNVLAVTRVIGVTGNMVDVVTGNDDVARYEQREDGIYRVASSAYLIKAPVQRGATWPSGGDKTATVVATDTVLETPAGSYRDCVTIEEIGAETTMTIRTVYCPDVGPVEVQSHMQLRGQDVAVIARLRGAQISGH